jgi:prepilin-type N-terminal cleavage/methylation domain-containing protein
MITSFQSMSPTRVAPRRRSDGFTLIELVVTLFIITLILGMATFTLSTAGPKKKLLKPAVKMKVFAQKALSLARNTRRQHSIFMNENFFILRETYMRQEDINEALDPTGRRAGFATRDDEEEPQAEIRMVERYELEEGTEIKVRRWNQKDWHVPKNEDWNFYTSGICDPIMVQFSTKDGFIEMEFNPLTAKVQIDGERFEIYQQD